MIAPILIHGDCIMCIAQARALSAEQALVFVLSILHTGEHGAEEVHSDLCFSHRRAVEDNSRRAEANP